MIYATITTSIKPHPHKKVTSKLWLNRGFQKNLLGSIVMNLKILTSTLNFLPAFLHCDKIYLSKHKFRSIKISRSFCFSLSQILVLPMNDLCLCPYIRRWHFFLVQFHLASLKLLKSQWGIMFQSGYKIFKIWVTSMEGSAVCITAYIVHPVK